MFEKFFSKARSEKVNIEKPKSKNVLKRKILPIIASACVAMSVCSISACAIDGDSAASVALATVNKDDVVGTMMPFVNAGIPLLAVVGGLKLGKGFLKSCLH